MKTKKSPLSLATILQLPCNSISGLSSRNVSCKLVADQLQPLREGRERSSVAKLHTPLGVQLCNSRNRRMQLEALDLLEKKSKEIAKITDDSTDDQLKQCLDVARKAARAYENFFCGRNSDYLYKGNRPGAKWLPGGGR